MREFNSKKIGIHTNEASIISKNNELLYKANSNKIENSIVINGLNQNEDNYNKNAHRTSNINLGEFSGKYN